MSTTAGPPYDACVESDSDDDEEQTQIRPIVRAVQDASSTAASHWEDEPQPLRRRRIRTHRPPSARHTAPPSSSHAFAESRAFLPPLTRILEGRSSDDTGRWQAPVQNSSRHRSHSRSAGARDPRKHCVGSSRQLQERVRALVSPSLYSVLSTQTTATSSSSGSNSTVTQGSFGRSPRVRGSQREAEQEGRERGHRKRRKRRQEKVDVFSFLERDAGEENAAWQSSSNGSSSDDEAKDAGQAFTPARSDATRSPSESPVIQHKPLRNGSWPLQEQLHSDSGISIRSSSPDSVGRASVYKQPAIEQVQDQDEPRSEPRGESVKARPEPLPTKTEFQRRFSSSSGAQEVPVLHALPHQAPHPNTTIVTYGGPQQYAETGQLTRACEKRVGAEQESRTGYELLASRLCTSRSSSQGAVTPVYRRFESLNHRILLHLQDEVAELEEQLLDIDRCITLSTGSVKSRRPASRRAEARYGDELHFRRTELLGLIFLKIKQYNKALSSFQAVCRNMNQATEEDIGNYRDMTNEVKSVVEEELRFLDHGMDLLSVSSTQAKRSGDASSRTERIAMLGPPTAILAAYVLFAATPDSMVRLMLLLALSGAGVAAVHFADAGSGPLTYHERAGCLILYVGVLVVIAGTVS